MDIQFSFFGKKSFDVFPLPELGGIQARERDMKDCLNLLSQLMSPGKQPSPEYLRVAYEKDGFYVLRDMDDTYFGVGKIVGMTTVGIIWKPSGAVAYIHDVVVDKNYRGKGLADILVIKAIALAKTMGAVEIELTSNPNNPARAAAIKLYLKHGFKQRETNVYQLKL